MTIKGVPKGWEPVRFGLPKQGECFLDNLGSLEQAALDFEDCSYLIIRKIEKPKTYRPFANAEEFKPHRDRWIRRITNGGAFKIHDYCNDGSENDRSEVTSWEEFFSFGYVFDDDGSPFGVEVTE